MKPNPQKRRSNPNFLHLRHQRARSQTLSHETVLVILLKLQRSHSQVFQGRLRLRRSRRGVFDVVRRGHAVLRNRVVSWMALKSIEEIAEDVDLFVLDQCEMSVEEEKVKGDGVEMTAEAESCHLAAVALVDVSEDMQEKSVDFADNLVKSHRKCIAWKRKVLRSGSNEIHVLLKLLLLLQLL